MVYIFGSVPSLSPNARLLLTGRRLRRKFGNGDNLISLFLAFVRLHLFREKYFSHFLAFKSLRKMSKQKLFSQLMENPYLN